MEKEQSLLPPPPPPRYYPRPGELPLAAIDTHRYNPKKGRVLPDTGGTRAEPAAGDWRALGHRAPGARGAAPGEPAMPVASLFRGAPGVWKQNPLPGQCRGRREPRRLPLQPCGRTPVTDPPLPQKLINRFVQLASSGDKRGVC